MKPTAKSSKEGVRENKIANRRAPLLRSANWAILIGSVAGCIVSITQITSLQGGVVWSIIGGLAGMLVGVLVGGDLLIPGPGRASLFTNPRGDRVGPFRWGVMMSLLMIEGLIFGAYLWGSVVLTCESSGNQLATTEQVTTEQIDCRRVLWGWFGSRQIGETLYDNVIGTSISVHDELLLQHGDFQQSQAVSGFGEAEMVAVEKFLAAPTSPLSLVASDWRIRLGSPVCFAIALLCGVWALISLRRGLHLLNEQFALNEVYWGWSRPADR